MNAIHEHAQLSPTCDLGTQIYEQWAVQKERLGELRFTSSTLQIYYKLAIVYLS